MSEALWSIERICSETVVGFELFVNLSTVLRCSLKRSSSRRFVSAMYCLWIAMYHKKKKRFWSYSLYDK